MNVYFVKYFIFCTPWGISFKKAPDITSVPCSIVQDLSQCLHRFDRNTSSEQALHSMVNSIIFSKIMTKYLIIISINKTILLSKVFNFITVYITYKQRLTKGMRALKTYYL